MSAPIKTLGQPVHPAVYLSTLARMKATTHTLPDAIVREESGIRDGDGCWHDVPPITRSICRLVELHFGNGQPWSGALRKINGEWRQEPAHGDQAAY